MLDKAKEWLSHPFEEKMDAWHWFLFVGLLILLMIVWRFILAHMKGVLA